MINTRFPQRMSEQSSVNVDCWMRIACTATLHLCFQLSASFRAAAFAVHRPLIAYDMSTFPWPVACYTWHEHELVIIRDIDKFKCIAAKRPGPELSVSASLIEAARKPSPDETRPASRIPDDTKRYQGVDSQTHGTWSCRSRFCIGAFFRS